MGNILEASNVTKRFGGLTAVNDVTLAVRKSSIAALIGPNGAGKTTLFNVLAGSSKPTTGSVHFDGTPITGLAEHRVVKLGVARTFQHTALFPDITVLENVLVGASARMRASVAGIIFGTRSAQREEREAQAKARELLDFVGIFPLRDRLARELSYGDGRRAAIARALASDPRLLMLDEPAAGMNTAETRRLMDLLRAVNARDVTLLVIEHNMDFVMSIADEITVLDHGYRIAVGKPEDVRKDPRVVEAYLGAGDPRATRRHRRVREP